MDEVGLSRYGYSSAARVKLDGGLIHVGYLLSVAIAIRKSAALNASSLGMEARSPDVWSVEIASRSQFGTNFDFGGISQEMMFSYQIKLNI